MVQPTLLSRLTNNIVRPMCLALGFGYVLLVGFFSLGQNLQTTILETTLLAALFFLIRRRGDQVSAFHYATFFFSFVLSLSFSMTTNSLVVAVTQGTNIFLLSLLFLLLFEKQMPNGPVEYVYSLLAYLKYLIFEGLSLEKIQQFFSIKMRKVEIKVNQDFLSGLFVSIPVLLLFHFLFTQVNADYAVFVNSVFIRVWQIVKYIVNIEFVWIALKGIVEAYLLFVLFTVRHTKLEDEIIKRNWPLTVFKTVLVSVVILFLIFSSFQSRLLFLDVFHLGFKEVSQYVRQGFSELLVITFAGFFISLFVLGRLPEEKTATRKHVQLLLSIFCLELISITVFIFHKLYALQAVFGFKDQRIVASVAIMLIVSSCVFLFLKIWEKVSFGTMFRWQVMLLASSVLLINVFNLDLFISKYNSVRQVVNEQEHKDYSYLLGNSYDNVSVWPNLMKEAQEVGIPKPDKTYYWGYFSDVRSDFFRTSYAPICEMRSRTHRSGVSVANSYLESRYQKLVEKYDMLNSESSLLDLTNVNIREYQAYLFIKQNEVMVHDFIQLAKKSCEE